MKTELKPCPFCGGKANITYGETAMAIAGMWVKCERCGAQSSATSIFKADLNNNNGGANAGLGWQDVYDAAAERWNRRAGEQ